MGTLVIGGFENVIGKRFNITYKSINDVIFNSPLRDCNLRVLKNVMLEHVGRESLYLGSEEKGFNIIHQYQVVEMIQLKENN